MDGSVIIVADSLIRITSIPSHGWNELIVIRIIKFTCLTNNDRPEPIIKTDFIEVSLGILLKLVCCVVGLKFKVTELKHLKPEP
jgi:hypothetical protein